MVSKTKVNGRHGPSQADAGDGDAAFRRLLHDVIELGEMQVKLLTLDLKQTASKMITPTVLAVVGVAVLLGCVPVALTATAHVFVEFLQWPRSAAFGIATLIGLVLCGLMLAVAYFKFKKGFATLQRSQHEFSQNVAWLKSRLRGSTARCTTPKRSTSNIN